MAVLAPVLRVEGSLAGWLSEVAPPDADYGGPALAILSAVGFGALALGLARQKRLSWWLAVATLAATLLAQASVLSHPLGVVVIGGAVAVLLADRSRYRVETGATWSRWVLGLLLLAGFALAAETALLLAATGVWPEPLSVLGYITTSVGDVLGIDNDASQSILDVTSRGGLFALLLLAARLPVVLGAVGILARVPEPAADPTVREHARSIAAQHGCGALLPFQLGEDKLLYCPPGPDGCIVYGLAGRTAVVVGDPIAPADSRDALLGAFLERSHRLDRVVTFYQATPALRPVLVNLGYRLFRVGQEAIVDLATFSLAGSHRANLRHTITRAGRGGLTVRFYRHGISGDDAPRMLDELLGIDEAWRRHAGPRLGFTISDFDRDALSELPVSVASDAENRLVAFTSFRPTGSDGGWVLDLMRRTPDGIPGAVEWCIAEAAQAFRSGGASKLSLGLAPLAGLSVHEGPLLERAMALASRLVRPWYDVSSLAFFKAKFDPRWEPRYGAVASRLDGIGFTMSLLRLHTHRSRLRAVIALAVDPSSIDPAGPQAAR